MQILRVLPRSITLPIEAASALREILGILGDNGYPGMRAHEPERAIMLEGQIWATWEPEAWETLVADDRAVELELEDASLLLGGLAFTETMSEEFPWIDMVRWTVDFIAAELRPLWTEAEWALLDT